MEYYQDIIRKTERWKLVICRKAASAKTYVRHHLGIGVFAFNGNKSITHTRAMCFSLPLNGVWPNIVRQKKDAQQNAAIFVSMWFNNEMVSFQGICAFQHLKHSFVIVVVQNRTPLNACKCKRIGGNEELRLTKKTTTTGCVFLVFQLIERKNKECFFRFERLARFMTTGSQTQENDTEWKTIRIDKLISSLAWVTQ